MLRPSYSELMKVLNNDPNLDNKVTSRYAIVIAASKRARQLIDGESALAKADTDKAVSVAVNEMYMGLVRINPEGDSNLLQDETQSANEAQYFENEFNDEFESEDTFVELMDNTSLGE